ncbi:hypothetical protein PGT21_028638 [Puccinia graminis f. sp. tritici]|uniref:Uncharacterized protein n=1 Tax=Puccinia graminis f. sp. tritici TaxID=56615 RepID=A0A5B0NDM8_PUCGR|nr:hypothetical protein PGT21_028638 [Puccinia graminis f. sp. tritici]
MIQGHGLAQPSCFSPRLQYPQCSEVFCYQSLHVVPTAIKTFKPVISRNQLQFLLVFQGKQAKLREAKLVAPSPMVHSSVKSDSPLAELNISLLILFHNPCSEQKLLLQSSLHPLSLPVIGQPLLPPPNWSLLNHTAHPQQSQTGHSNINNSVWSLDGASSRVVIKQNSEASLFIGYIPIDYESEAAIGSYVNHELVRPCYR